MTSKEKLNSILRLRLFYSTERQLAELVGYSLKGNHFSRLKPFHCEAFFSRFADICGNYTQRRMDLDTMLRQYAATSRFFKTRISGTAHEVDKRFLATLLSHIFLDEVVSVAQRAKDLLLCAEYDRANRDGELNIGILLLLTHGLIPTFSNKRTQDITDIVADYRRTYSILLDIAHQRLPNASVQYSEMLCLKEMRQLIDDEKPDDPYINRLLLIHITNDTLRRIFALEQPVQIKEYYEEEDVMDLWFYDYWRCDGEPDNVFYRFVPLVCGAWCMTRFEFDPKAREIRHTRYQLKFLSLGYSDIAYTTIMQPIFQYNNILHREQPSDALTYDYTAIEYEEDKFTARSLTFTRCSPMGDGAITLKPIKDDRRYHYYTSILAQKGIAKDCRMVSTHAQYDVEYEKMEFVDTERHIIFNTRGGIYRLDKLLDNCEETIPGILDVIRTDNILLSTLRDNGTTRRFLSFDNINRHIELSELLTKPYFHRINTLAEIFPGNETLKAAPQG
ncbi:MAG: hypothetical protein HUK04_04705 [Bacteroidaceae bacterium]|nr:hypothetical protein [Bacteroidaceae bacterium]